MLGNRSQEAGEAWRHLSFVLWPGSAPETNRQRSGVGLWLPPPSSGPLGTPWRPFLWGVRGSGLAVPGRSASSHTAEGEVNTGSPWQPAEPGLKVLVAREALVVSCF